MTRRPSPNPMRRRLLFCARIALACLGIAAAPGRALGQEAIRPSVAGEEAAALRKTTLPTAGYNMELGPLLLYVSGGVGVQYNDNISLSETGRQADLILTPALNLAVNWPVTRSNTLTMNTSIGYQYYLLHPDKGYSNITIAPNSQVSYDVYTGNLRINFHDQFSVTDNPAQVGALSNVTTYVQYTNVFGVGLLADLNTAILTLDLDYTSVETPASGVKGNASIPDDSNSTFSSVFSALFQLDGANNVGMNANGAYTTYATAGRGSALSVGVGPVWQSTLTRHTQLNVSAGFQGIFFRGGGSSIGSVVGGGGSSDSTSYYASVTLSHQLNRYYTDNLSFGRESQLGVTSAQEEFYFLSYTSNWIITRPLSLGTTLSLNDVDETGGGSSAHYDNLGFSLTSAYQLTRRLNVTLSYNFSLKLASVTNQSYYQNALALQFAYRF